MTLEEAGEGVLDLVKVDRHAVDEVERDVVDVDAAAGSRDDLEGVEGVVEQPLGLGDEVVGDLDVATDSTRPDAAKTGVRIENIEARQGRTHMVRTKNLQSAELSLPSA